MKAANIVIDHLQLKSGKIDLNTLRVIYTNLPSDSKIKMIHTALSSVLVKITVESDSFIDTPISSPLPEIPFTYDSNHNIDGLDMSKVMQTSTNSSVPLLCAKCVLSPCICQPVVAPTVTGIYNVTLPYFNFSNINGDLAIDLSKLESHIKICNHEWKNYDSGWTTYDYCTKCNEKKT